MLFMFDGSMMFTCVAPARPDSKLPKSSEMVVDEIETTRVVACPVVVTPFILFTLFESTFDVLLLVVWMLFIVVFNELRLFSCTVGSWFVSFGLDRLYTIEFGPLCMCARCACNLRRLANTRAAFSRSVFDGINMISSSFPPIMFSANERFRSFGLESKDTIAIVINQDFQIFQQSIFGI